MVGWIILGLHKLLDNANPVMVFSMVYDVTCS